MILIIILMQAILPGAGFVFAGDNAKAGIFESPLVNPDNSDFDMVCEKISRYNIIRGKFTQVKEDENTKKTYKSQGDFTIAKDFGIIWESAKPIKITNVAGKDYLLTILPSGKKQRIDGASNKTFIRTADLIRSVFSGDKDALMQYYDIYWSEPAAGGKSAEWTIGLIPKDKSLAFIANIIIKGDNFINTVIMSDKTGVRTTYNFTGQSPAETLTDYEKKLFDNTPN